MTYSGSTPLPERVSTAYAKLSAVAADLNDASDELGKTISQIDTALKKLNVGVIVWITIQARPADPNNGETWYEADHLGYAKVNGRWGVAIRTVGEDIQNPDHCSDEQWLFNDAPRALRLQAIDKIPDLLEGLAQVAAKTKEEIRKRLKDAQDVADAVTKASGGRLPLRGGITPPPKVGEVK